MAASAGDECARRGTTLTVTIEGDDGRSLPSSSQSRFAACQARIRGASGCPTCAGRPSRGCRTGPSRSGGGTARARLLADDNRLRDYHAPAKDGRPWRRRHCARGLARRFDLLVSDVMMPGLDLRALAPCEPIPLAAIPIMLLSARAGRRARPASRADYLRSRSPARAGRVHAPGCRRRPGARELGARTGGTPRCRDPAAPLLAVHGGADFITVLRGPTRCGAGQRHDLPAGGAGSSLSRAAHRRGVSGFASRLRDVARWRLRRNVDRP